MTKPFEFKQSSDLNPALSEPAARTMSADSLTGRWLNTDPDTKGLAEIVVQRDGDQFFVSAIGVGPQGPINWALTRAKSFANLEEEAGQRALALAVTFEFVFMTAETHIRVNKGVLVIVLFHNFTDNSGRSNYVNREFFYRKD